MSTLLAILGDPVWAEGELKEHTLAVKGITGLPGQLLPPANLKFPFLLPQGRGEDEPDSEPDSLMPSCLHL